MHARQKKDGGTLYKQVFSPVFDVEYAGKQWRRVESKVFATPTGKVFRGRVTHKANKDI